MDALQKATGDVEVIAVIDGPTECAVPVGFERVRLICLDEPHGMRHGINLAAQAATGDYLLKLDAHCVLSEGYDEVLKAECDDDWVVVARRNELSTDWQISDTTPVDYFYMSNPWTSPQGYMRMSRWISRDRQRRDVSLDETMSFSGSFWFMPKAYFEKRIGSMDEKRFGPWSGEPEEIACKTWLTGGKVMINKRVVYAHMRGKRSYRVPWSHALRGLQASANYWANDKWPERTRNFEWLIDHFWPLPSQRHHCNGERYFWEDDWKNHARV